MSEPKKLLSSINRLNRVGVSGGQVYDGNQTFEFGAADGWTWRVYCGLDATLGALLERNRTHDDSYRANLTYVEGDVLTAILSLFIGNVEHIIEDIIWIDRTERVMMHSRKRRISQLRELVDRVSKPYLDELEKLVEGCGHPHGSVVKVPHSNTGNYDPSADCYWFSCTCGVCGRQWQEDQK